jgi:hypothetical protein
MTLICRTIVSSFVGRVPPEAKFQWQAEESMIKFATGGLKEQAKVDTALRWYLRLSSGLSYRGQLGEGIEGPRGRGQRGSSLEGAGKRRLWRKDRRKGVD